MVSQSVTTPPLPESGERIEVLTTQSGTGGTIWASAGLLTRYLLHHREELRVADAAIIELGSGTGIVGLFAAALGARQVLLTDVLHERRANTNQLFYSKPTALGPLLHANVAHNRRHWETAKTAVAIAELSFGNDHHAASARCASPGGAGFDLLLGSDITFRPVTGVDHAQLTRTIVRLLRPGGMALICHETRLKMNVGCREPADSSLADLQECVECEAGLTWEVVHDERPDDAAAQNGMLTIVCVTACAHSAAHVTRPRPRAVVPLEPEVQLDLLKEAAVPLENPEEAGARGGVTHSAIKSAHEAASDSTAPRSECTKEAPERRRARQPRVTTMRTLEANGQLLKVEQQRGTASATSDMTSDLLPRLLVPPCPPDLT